MPIRHIGAAALLLGALGAATAQAASPQATSEGNSDMKTFSAATAARAGTASVFDIVAAALVVQFHGDSFNSIDCAGLYSRKRYASDFGRVEAAFRR